MATFLEAPPAKGTEPFGHKYGLTRDGRVVPAHEVIGKNGKVRSCTIREIRKCSPDNPVIAVHGDQRTEVVRIVPSVTTIIAPISREEYREQHKRQIILAAMHNPPTAGESEQDYIDRIDTEAHRHLNAASKLGSRVHKAIEEFGTKDPDADIAAYVEAANKQHIKLGITGSVRELPFLSQELGIGGTIDMPCEREGRPGIVDDKTRTKLEKRKTDVLQLAAYGRAHYGNMFLEVGWAANVVVSTKEPGEAETFFYETEELKEAFEVFRSIQRVWNYVNGVDV